MKQINHLKLVLLLLILVAPNVNADVDEAADRGESVTREFMQFLEIEDSDSAIRLLDERLWEQTRAPIENAPNGMLELLSSIFPDGQPKSLDLIQSRADEIEGGFVAYTIWEYSWAEDFVFGKFTTVVTDDSAKIINYKVIRQDRSVADVSFPGFEKAVPKNYMAAAALIGSLSLMLVTFVVALRTPIKRRKWLWCLLPLAGVGRVLFDWNYATYSVYWFSVHLLGAGVFSPGLGESYYLKFTIPVGAIVFLIFRKKIMSVGDMPDKVNGV